MICLTGDVHHMSLRINDQRFIPDKSNSEVRIARRYVDLLEKYQVKATLYICGKCFTQEWDDLRHVVASPLIEMAGHQYQARQPRPFFDWYGKKTGNWNGPYWFQWWDIRRTIEVCRQRTGYQLVSWRNHSYIVDPNTYPLLARHGVRLVSDEIRARNRWPRRLADGLTSHPLNVISDHDHLYHAHRTKEYVERVNRDGYGADEFGAVSYTIEKWGDLVLHQVEAIEKEGGLATILAHPLCMYLADRFATFEKLLDSFSRLQCIWARQIPDLMGRDVASGRPTERNAVRAGNSHAAADNL